MNKLVSDPAWVTQYSVPDLVEKTGTQGIELLNWLTARGSLGGQVAPGPRQLPHPDFQHGRGPPGDGQRLTSPLTTMPPENKMIRDCDHGKNRILIISILVYMPELGYNVIRGV